MSSDERGVRMGRMREVVREHNVYRWAGALIADLAAIRVDRSEPQSRQDTVMTPEPA